MYRVNAKKRGGAEDGRIHNPLFWTGFVWAVWQSGLILLYSASEGHHSVKAAQRESNRCVAILENLSPRGNFWPGACAAAIRELRSALSSKTSVESAADLENVSTVSFQSPPTSAGVPLVSYNSQRIEGGRTGRYIDTDATKTFERAPSGSDATKNDTRPYPSSSLLQQGTHHSNHGNVAPYGQGSDTFAAFPYVANHSRYEDYNLQGSLGAAQASFSGVSAMRHGSIGDNSFANSSDAWPDLAPALNRPGDRTDGFDDIFPTSRCILSPQ